MSILIPGLFGIGFGIFHILSVPMPRIFARNIRFNFCAFIIICLIILLGYTLNQSDSFKKYFEHRMPLPIFTFGIGYFSTVFGLSMVY